MSISHEIWLLDSARRQLESLSATPCIGWMLGYRSTTRIEILNICTALCKKGEILRTTDTPYSIEEEMEALHEALPRGVVVLGSVIIFDDKIPMSIITLLRSLSLLSKLAVAVHAPEAQSMSGIWCVGEITVYANSKGQDSQNLPDVQSEFLSRHLKLRWRVDTSVPMLLGQENQKSEIAHSLLGKSENGEMIVRIEDGEGEVRKVFSTKEKKNLAEYFTSSPGAIFDYSIFHSTDISTSCQAPYLDVERAAQELNIKAKSLKLQLEVYAFVPLSTPVSRLFQDYMKPALLQQLSGCHLESFEYCSLGFHIMSYLFPILVHYPFLPEPSNDEASHLNVRRRLHKRFLQKENRSVFRASCTLPCDPVSSSRLLSIHEHLPKREFGPGLVAMVNGTYEYCHYGQDQTNDAGWGCAYRSFQTVYSWFLHQNYTRQDIPSHKKIQDVLVEVGDKEPEFYGSKEWIGSIEVGTVLNELLGIEYSVVSKAAHQELSSIARELVRHFQKDGTPISIGGGVLAYTLLGIYFNDQMGDVELLILDPHYKGEDKIDAILKGGWIKWRTPEENAAAGGPLFAKNTHYNFMCPKRPSII